VHLQETHELLQSCVEEALDSQFAKLKAVRLNSKIEHDNTIALKEDRPLHIAYEPRSKSGTRSYGALINAELRLRLEEDNPEKLKAFLLDSLQDRVSILKELLVAEDAIWKAKDTMDRQKYAKWFSAEQAIPCILHLVCRVMEKLFWSFLASALDRYQDGDSKTRDAFVEAVTVHMNVAVIGTKKHPAQWTFPLKDNKGGGKTVEPRNMTGAHAKKCIVGLKSLATVVFSPSFDEMSQNPKHTRSQNETWETSWHDIMDTFVPLMEQLHQHEDFSDEQVLSFHCLAARFMHQYCDLFQGEGITNYIHLIGAGHITYYLRKYRNLNKFCQQG
jgi:hypothetical protein